MRNTKDKSSKAKVLLGMGLTTLLGLLLVGPTTFAEEEEENICPQPSIDNIFLTKDKFFNGNCSMIPDMGGGFPAYSCEYDGVNDPRSGVQIGISVSGGEFEAIDQLVDVNLGIAPEDGAFIEIPDRVDLYSHSWGQGFKSLKPVQVNMTPNVAEGASGTFHFIPEMKKGQGFTIVDFRVRVANKCGNWSPHPAQGYMHIVFPNL